MTSLKVRQTDGSYVDPNAVKVRKNGTWQDVTSVKIRHVGQWVDVYPQTAPTTSPSTSYIFVNDAQLSAQRQRVKQGVEPFASAYSNLINDANRALSASLEAVTDDGGGHGFVADGNHGRHDYLTARDQGRFARDSALAYWFTGDDKYARKAVDVIYHWCLNPTTYMAPTVDQVGNAVTIEQHITIPDFVYAASFVRDHSRWSNYSGVRPWDGGNSGDAESAFARWVRDRLDTFPANEAHYFQYNNQWTWRIVDQGVSAAYLEDDAYMTRVKHLYEATDPWTKYDRNGDGVKEDTDRPWNDYRPVDASDGYFAHERHRDEGFKYTAYNLKSFACIAALVEVWDGTDLWRFNAPTDPYSGSTLRKAFNWFEPYVLNVASWQWDTDGVVQAHDVEEAASAYELAHAHWNDYDAAIDHPSKVGGRPHYDRRLLGHVTLTHGVP